MKKQNFLFSMIAVVILCSIVSSCNEDEGLEPVTTDNEVSFTIDIQKLKDSPMLKSTPVYTLDSAVKVIFTVQTTDGSPTAYTSSGRDIYKMNGNYYTQKIVLETGDYKLTEFLLLDKSDNTIFAAPLEGSLQAQNVNDPLPIEFSVFNNIATTVDVEVVSTEDKVPEDFGLTRFRIIEVSTFSFMVGVADLEEDILLTAKITVNNGSYNYVQDLQNIANNIVTVVDNLGTYTLTIEKFGYYPYSYTFTIDSIKHYENIVGNLPLIVELVKAQIPANGLIAYYPFNGNANDESGNGNDGDVYGATLTSDRFGNLSSAYYFNGADDSIIVRKTAPFRLTSWTITGWINISSFPGWQTIIAMKNDDANNKYNYAVILDSLQLLASQYENCTDEDDHKVFSSQMQLNVWVYFASVRDNNTGEHAIYINGIKTDSNIWNDTPCDNEEEFRIGYAPIGPSSIFNGVIDDIRVYGIAISEPEIQAIYLE